MNNKDILAAAAVAAISAFPAVAAAQDVRTSDTIREASPTDQRLPTDNILNDSRPAMRAMLSARLNGLVASGDNPSGDFEVADYFIGWNPYGLVVKEPSPTRTSFESDDLKSLIGNQNLGKKIASGQATYRDLIETINEMGLDQRSGSVRMGKDGVALI